MIGSWLHCGYHLTTSIVAPALLSLPFALSMLGWVGGIISLLFCGVVTFYSYNLLSMVLEHHAMQGSRLLRFRDMASFILGTSLFTFIYLYSWFSGLKCCCEMGRTQMGQLLRGSNSIWSVLWCCCLWNCYWWPKP